MKEFIEFIKNNPELMGAAIAIFSSVVTFIFGFISALIIDSVRARRNRKREVREKEREIISRRLDQLENYLYKIAIRWEKSTVSLLRVCQVKTVVLKIEVMNEGIYGKDSMEYGELEIAVVQSVGDISLFRKFSKMTKVYNKMAEVQRGYSRKLNKYIDMGKLDVEGEYDESVKTDIEKMKSKFFKAQGDIIVRIDDIRRMIVKNKYDWRYGSISEMYEKISSENDENAP